MKQSCASILAVLGLLCVPATVAWCGDKVKPAAQEVCPIMTALPVDEDSKVVYYKGVKIYVCCDTCVQKWRADPEAYLNRTYLPQLGATKIPPRSIEQVFCPVYRNRVVSARDPFVVYKGVKVYLFNKAAVKKWQANPDRYADSKYLPQLKSGS